MSETEVKTLGEALLPEIERLRSTLEKTLPDHIAEHARAEEAKKLWGCEESITRAGLPKRHASNANLDRTGEWGRKETVLQAKLGSGFLVALIGNRGPGKTQLGVELIKHFIKTKRKQGYFCSATQFFMAVKASYKHETECEEDVINRFVGYGLLVIDEIGQRSETEWENRLLYELLNRRYNAMKDTLLISNQDKATLQSALGSSLASRMDETGGIIECNWQSYR